MGTRPVVARPSVGNPGARLEPRALVIGVVVNGQAKAYPLSSVLGAAVINDTVGGVPLVLVVGGDGKSVRAFARPRGLGGLGERSRSVAPLVKRGTGAGFRLVEPHTGAAWDFSGKAAGSARVPPLDQIGVSREYWFSWSMFHPDTALYRPALLNRV
jgi:hypothetical protein